MFNRSSVRIAWKEYRSQQTLWTALLAGSCLLQMLYLGFSPQAQHEFRGYPFQVGAVLSVCYAVACGALLFAGEREEGTDGLLQAFGVHPGDLTIGKVGYACGSLALFTGLAFLFAAVVTAFDRGVLNIGPIEDPNELLSVYLLAIPLGFTSSMLASLLTKRVMAALISGIVILLITTGGAHNLLRSGQQLSDIIFAASFFIAGLVLIPRWMERENDWPQLGQFIFTPAASVGRNSFLARFLKTRVLATSPSARAYGVIVWKELRTAIPVLLLGIIALSGILPAFLSSVSINATGWIPGWMSLSAVLTVVLLYGIGLSVYAGENRQQLMRFYSDRGVSPGLIWTAKHSVWMVTLFVLSTVGFIYLMKIRALQQDYRPPAGWAVVNASLTSVFVAFTSSVLAAYAAVQLLSLWFRKLLLSASLAFVICILLILSALFQFAFELPLWLCTFPLILGWMAASFFTMEGWINERRSWKRITKQAAWGTVPVLVSLAGAYVWRIVEIPAVDPGFPWQSQEKRLAITDPEWTWQWKLLLNDAQNPKANEQNIRERLTVIAERIAEGLPPDIDPEVRGQTHLFNIFQMNVLGPVSTQHKNRAPQTRDEEWNSLRNAMLVSVYLSEQSLYFSNFINTSRHILELNERMREWAQSPGQTPESLDRLIAFDKRYATFPAKNHYVALRRIYEGRPYGSLGLDVRESGYLYRFPGSLLTEERSRLIRLLNQKSHLVVNYPVKEWGDHGLQQIKAWERTTPLDYSPLQWQGEQVERFLDQTLKACWATTTIARLEKYRLQNGAYPARLELVFEGLPPSWKGIQPGDFRYEPLGLRQKLAVSSSYVLPAGQPVLFENQSLTTSLDDILPLPDQARYAGSPAFQAFKKQADAGEILWSNVQPEHRYSVNSGYFERIFNYIDHPAPLTDRIKYVRFGEQGPDAEQ